MTLGSLFDGLGGWLLAARHSGVTPVWASEIDPFPAAVTGHHFPDVEQLGDITKLDGAKLPPVDIICAGSPCQDLSVAGKQEGLNGARSGLFHTAIDIVRCMRNATNGRFPRYFIWENVPGAFSSNGGNDFRAVLEEIGQTEIPMPKSSRWANAGLVRGKSCEIAWRVLDAQHWGVPQRRKRIFLVADFTGQSAGEILFEPEGLPGDSAEGGEAREGASAGAERGAGAAGRACLTPWDCQSKRICSVGSFGKYDETKTATTLKASGGDVGGGSENLAVEKTIRRLTPLECERLQGLPDGYTDIEFLGKPAPDSRRYKALGNGMAQPIANWVIRRIVEVQKGE